MNFLRLLFILIIGFGLAACSDDDKNAELPPEQFKLVDELGSPGDGYNLNALNLQSVTRLQADTLLMNYKDPLSFEIKGQFIGTDSKLAVNAYTTNLALNDGTRLEFIPLDNGIDVYLYTRDYPLFHFCTIPSSLTTDGQFQLRVQLYNRKNVGPTILIWNIYNDGKNKTKKNYEYLDASNADCSSLEKIFIDHFGSGRLWGFEIHQTRMFETKRSEYLL